MPDFLLPKGNIISTEDVDEKEQLEYWIDMICDEFVQLDCITGQRKDFKGKLRGTEFDKIRVSEVSADPQDVIRSRKQIEINIRHPQLSPALIARHHHISERYQRMLFASTGTTVSRYILEQRLALCREALENKSLRDYSITQIAFSYGFNDAAHFSRKFKERYGAPPKEYRDDIVRLSP